MGLFSQRKATDSATPAGAGGTSLDSAETTRSRARQRLIGAVVLLTVGVIGFPLIFESQPRPLPVDIPIEIPRKDGAPALALPGAKPVVAGKAALAAASAAAATPPVVGQDLKAPAAVTAKAPSEIITESAADAGREVVSPSAKVASAPPAAEAVAKPAPTVPADGARAQALLDGKAAAAAEAGAEGAARFIVQVGAFADPVLARETRMKVERLGLKTYTQVAETAAGKRIRVRVGPFATRADADKAIAKTRAAGLPAAVLTL